MSNKSYKAIAKYKANDVDKENRYCSEFFSNLYKRLKELSGKR